MTARIRVALTACAAAAAIACGAQGAPDGRDDKYGAAAIEASPPTLADAAKATYWGGKARQITLADGVFQGSKGQRVELVRDHYQTADLEGDGAVDAIVLLSVSNAGDESGQYIAVLRHVGTDTISLGTALLGQDVEVQNVKVAEHRILVDLVRGKAPGSAGAGEARRFTYELRRGGLVQVSDDPRPSS